MKHDPNEPLPHDFDWNELYAGDKRDYMPPDPLMVELIEALEPGHALDVGCGAGGLLAAMAERGWVISGIDVAANAIEAARRVLGQRGADATLEVADAATWRPPRTYDLVTNCFAKTFFPPLESIGALWVQMCEEDLSQWILQRACMLTRCVIDQKWEVVCVPWCSPLHSNRLNESEASSQDADYE